MDFPVFDSVFIYLRRKNVLSEIFKKVFRVFEFFKKVLTNAMKMNIIIFAVARYG